MDRDGCSRAARAKRNTYQKFGRLVLEFERGPAAPLTTADIARRYQIACSTANRWALELQKLFDLREDSNGCWVRKMKPDR